MSAAWVTAEENAGLFLEWYDTHEPGRLFSFIHFFDVHSDFSSGGGCLPYESSAELRVEFAGCAPPGFSGCLAGAPGCCASEYLSALSQGVERAPATHTRYVSSLYDAGLRKLDDLLERFFAELERRGLLEKSLVIITSDHGEAFMEHGEFLHGSFYDEIMHVPLLISAPWLFDAGEVNWVTRSIDIAPTILDFCGVGNSIGEGWSLAESVVNDRRPACDEVFFNESVLRASDEVGLFKLEMGSDFPAFYDLSRDPFERQNLLSEELAPAQHKRVANGVRRLVNLRRASVRHLEYLGRAPTVDVNEQDLRALKQLGY